MHVPLLDLKTQYASLRDEIRQVIDDVCDSQLFVLGPHVEQLETEIAAYVHARHGIGVSSGTDALLLALMALDIGSGDEVITTPYTFFATGGTIARVGARPVFCDIDLPSFNLSARAVAEFLKNDCDRDGGRLVNRSSGGSIKALMPVHLYGQMADMTAFQALAEQYGLKLIEDAAQAIGAAQADGRRAGSIGDIGCLSFFPTKNLGAFGDAGMCVTSDSALVARLMQMRVHGGERRYFHSTIGGNFRLDALQAAILLVKLKHLDQWTQQRQANAALYDRLFEEAKLGEIVKRPRAEPNYRHIFNQYVIRVPDRDALKRYLADRGVGTEIYYPLALHQQQCFQYLDYEADAFPNALLAARESLALPIYPELAEAQIEYVVSAIASFFGQETVG